MTHRRPIIASRRSLKKLSAFSYQLSARGFESRVPRPAPRTPPTALGLPAVTGLSSTASRAFSLVELLVVIGIIALLVGILLPSLSNARTESKRSTVKQLLASIDRGMEVFNTDFKQYPDSSRRPDPLKMAGDSPPEYLNGAHWLARAMVGHDGQGLDYGARTLEGGAATYDLTDMADIIKNPFLTGGVCVQRRGSYIQKPSYDSDTRVGANNPSRPGPQTGRIVLKDIFEFPILYYRANTKAPKAFSFDGVGGGSSHQGAPGDQMGKYNLRDNANITSAYLANAQEPSSYTRGSNALDWVGLALVNTNETHGLGVFGSMVNPKDRSASVSPVDPKPVGRYFTDFLFDGNAYKTSNVVKAVNETTFVLISAGPDGLYGTPDDVTNFK